ncbi:hypothetical protein J5X98_18675 [Leptothermofonsia sichuanensis E412]|uniref:hypothetical protein n=1 Tax=Leptothermofonsia sichuanensis TaxID=2917832 RepID=UPI001CA74565|nr:hypothetical protein [Leptothermofonsia sichuanensis]QZZ19390.1 hypothetical protein J5X98_18675 [Leptothermofonsia sichuanensis E412]
MTTVAIDRLTLKLSGLCPHQGQHLAQLLTQRPAHASLPTASTPDFDRLNIQSTAQPHDNLDRSSLSPIVSERLNQLLKAG